MSRLNTQRYVTWLRIEPRSHWTEFRGLFEAVLAPVTNTVVIMCVTVCTLTQLDHLTSVMFCRRELPIALDHEVFRSCHIGTLQKE